MMINLRYKYLLIFSFITILSGVIIYGVFNFINQPIDTKNEKARIERIKNLTGIDETPFSDFPLINDRREGCIFCHDKMDGLSSSHAPEKIGCYSCHLGNRLTKDKNLAHNDMIMIPGNSSNAEKTCGIIGCHPQMISRMQNNIMNTMNGVVAVDKWTFEETSDLNLKQNLSAIKFSPAEKHLRNLCASCHLSNEKTEYGPINELSRGGGCLACHLSYSEDEYSELKKTLPLREGQSRKTISSSLKNRIGKYDFVQKKHPDITVKVEDKSCFGCHSRSGRISLSYEGWHETILRPSDVKGKSGFRQLDDGRIVQQIKKDIHFEKGMMCIDCHTSYEIMGDGNYAVHKEEQMKIQCIDCHLIEIPKTQRLKDFDFESRQISELLGLNDLNKNYLTSAKNGFPFVNVFEDDQAIKLIKKSSKEILEIKKPLKICYNYDAHKNLSCTSCHNSWTPQCINCHTEYSSQNSMFDLLDNKESKGEWLEVGKNYFAELATLGIKEYKQKDGSLKKVIDEFTPGMVLTIDKKDGSRKIFKRLFAPSFSHTIRRESRTCEQCHNNSVAIGYGRGKLEYRINKDTGSWKFTPLFQLRIEDGLPEDAWIGFLKEGKKNSATRDYMRPFSIEEQKKILTVGACISCHKNNSSIMNSMLADFQSIFNKRSKKCFLPAWN